MPMDLEAIREALANTIRAGVALNLSVYPFAEDVGSLPAVIIEPEDAEWKGAFHNGHEEWEFNIWVLVSRAPNPRMAQKVLDQLLSGTGPNSIRRAVADDKYLGNPDNISGAYISRMSGYGGKFKWFDVPHVGAALKATVIVNN